MRKAVIILSVILVALLTSCWEIKTTNPTKTYKYWAGTNPPAGFELFSGQYWQSAHWTKEYIMYLEFQPTEIWWNEFVKQNNIVKDNGQWIIPTDAPGWFRPSGTSVRYRIESNFDQGSRYFNDASTGICYIYEIQL